LVIACKDDLKILDERRLSFMGFLEIYWLFILENTGFSNVWRSSNAVCYDFCLGALQTTFVEQGHSFILQGSILWIFKGERRLSSMVLFKNLMVVPTLKM
jgi:hypothetical protein